MLVAFNSFVRRQTAESSHSHFDGIDEYLIKLVEECWGDRKHSYRKDEDGNKVEMNGVWCVPVPAEGFWTNITQLEEGDDLVGTFSPRVPGEEPRKHTYKRNKDGLPKVPAKFVDIVCYAHDVLSEDGDAETDAEYEIVSINATIFPGDQPIHPDVLLANHFKLDGGTKTNMTAQQLEDQLRISVPYWRDKIPLEMV